MRCRLYRPSIPNVNSAHNQSTCQMNCGHRLPGDPATLKLASASSTSIVLLRPSVCCDLLCAATFCVPSTIGIGVPGLVATASHRLESFLDHDNSRLVLRRCLQFAHRFLPHAACGRPDRAVRYQSSDISRRPIPVGAVKDSGKSLRRLCSRTTTSINAIRISIRTTGPDGVWRDSLQLNFQLNFICHSSYYRNAARNVRTRNPSLSNSPNPSALRIANSLPLAFLRFTYAGISNVA